jgi:hypothetical protein
MVVSSKGRKLAALGALAAFVLAAFALAAFEFAAFAVFAAFAGFLSFVSAAMRISFPAVKHLSSAPPFAASSPGTAQ